MAKAGDAEELDQLLLDPVLPFRLINSYSVLMVEHDLGLPNLVTWYQKNDPLSPWAPLARAALFASTGDELNSAREYSRAAELFTKLRKAGGSAAGETHRQRRQRFRFGSAVNALSQVTYSLRSRHFVVGGR